MAYKSSDKTIQLLRGIAILLVLAFHADRDLVGWGFIGVDIFFVVSGWLLSHRIVDLCIEGLEKKRVFRPYKAYLLGRLNRIYPAFLTSSLITILFVSVTLNVGGQIDRAIKQLVAALLGVSNWTAPSLAGAYFDPGPNPYLHLWSLSAELQIYAFSPFLIMLTMFLLRRLNITKITTQVRILFAISALMSILATYYSTSFRFTEFLFGVAAYQFHHENSYLSTRNRLFSWWLPATLLLTASFMITQDPIRKFQYVIVVISGIFLISPRAWWSKSHSFTLAKSLSLLLYFGKISFPLYLVHYPILVSVKHSELNLFDFRESRDVVSAVGVISSILVAAYIHRFFEFSQKIEWKSFTRSLIPIVTVSNIFILIFIFTMNSIGYLGFNHHRDYPEKIGSRDYQGCSFQFKGAAPCIWFENRSDRSVALIGDSHAMALTDVVFQVTKSEKFTFENWATTGCKYYSTTLVNQRSDSQDSCHLRNVAFDKRLKSEELDVVFVAWRSQNCSFNEFRGLCGSEFTSFMIQSVHFLEKYAKEVVVIGPNSEVSDRHKIFPDRSLFGRFVWPEVRYRLRDMEVQVLKDKLQLSNENIKSISIWDNQCTRSHCSIVDSRGLYILSDNHHLSRNGALLYRESLQKILREYDGAR